MDADALERPGWYVAHRIVIAILNHMHQSKTNETVIKDTATESLRPFFSSEIQKKYKNLSKGNRMACQKIHIEVPFIGCNWK